MVLVQTDEVDAGLLLGSGCVSSSTGPQGKSHQNSRNEGHFGFREVSDLQGLWFSPNQAKSASRARMMNGALGHRQGRGERLNQKQKACADQDGAQRLAGAFSDKKTN